MAVAQWESLQSCKAILESNVPSHTNLWIGHQGITGIKNFKIRTTPLEIVINLELVDIHTEPLEIHVSPDLLRLSGLYYEVAPDNDNESENSQDPAEQFYQPRSFHDLIPLPQAVVPEATVASLNEQYLRITLPLSQMLNPLVLSSLYTQPIKVPILPAQTSAPACGAESLLTQHW
jgi:HSP20 family molecular chaperone IbpA